VGEEGLVALELIRSALGEEAGRLLALDSPRTLSSSRAFRSATAVAWATVARKSTSAGLKAGRSPEPRTRSTPEDLALHGQGERGDGTHAGGDDALVHPLEERMARDVLHHRGQAGAQALADLGVAVHLDAEVLDVGRVARGDHHRRARAVVEEQAGPGDVQHLREAPGDVVQERVDVGRLGVPGGELEQRFQTSLLGAGLDLERVALAGLLQAPAELRLQLARRQERVGWARSPPSGAGAPTDPPPRAAPAGR
jgi:hypothetical protein